MIRSRAERVTPGRMQVLAMLLEEQRAVSHHEIEQWFQGKRRLDRVTLYRVLEWLNDRGYIHRVVGDDRVWRFRANTDLNPHQHAHFECTRCTTVICLDDTKAEYNRPSACRLSLPTYRVDGEGIMCRVRVMRAQAYLGPSNNNFGWILKAAVFNHVA